MQRLREIEDNSIDAIFADPPYFLSNGGISVQSGKQVCVDKGDWDKGGTPEYIYEFNRNWLSLCRSKLKDDGTIWISGTHHNIHVVMRCLQELGYKVLNTITWQKTDPPPNLSCKYFNFSTELIIWARKHEKKTHKFNYETMKQLNGGTQMTDVWRIPAVGKWEKNQGKHPTQKTLRLLYRIILASTNEGDTILDPFSGSGTTGIAANLLGRKYIGIEQDKKFCELSLSRRAALEFLLSLALKNSLIFVCTRLVTTQNFSNLLRVASKYGLPMPCKNLASLLRTRHIMPFSVLTHPNQLSTTNQSTCVNANIPPLHASNH